MNQEAIFAQHIIALFLKPHSRQTKLSIWPAQPIKTTTSQLQKQIAPVILAMG